MRCHIAHVQRGCFAPLARWVLAHWPGRRVALALDATSLGDRLTILTLSIVYKGCAVPIAWKILQATEKHARNPEWLALLDLVAPAFSADWQVIVLTDRGLYSRTLYHAIVGHGWHPFLRLNGQGTFHPIPLSPDPWPDVPLPAALTHPTTRAVA